MKQPIILIILFISLTSCYTYSTKILKKDTNWKIEKTQNYLLYYKPNSLTDKNINNTKTIIDSSLVLALKRSKIKQLKRPPFHLFVMDTQQEFIPFEGIPYFGLTYAKSNTILITNKFCAYPHEFFHLLSLQEWGETKTWIKEGSATYSDNKFQGKPIHNLCHLLYKQNKIIPFKILFSNKKFKKNDFKVTYPQSGSLISYIIEKYGFEAFLQVWKSKSIKKLPISQEQLFKDWLFYIQQY